MERNSWKKRYVVVSSFSGCGKSTALRRLKECEPIIYITKSLTTRERRDANDHYDYCSTEEFMRIKDSLLIESNYFDGNWYGTPKSELETNKGAVCIMELDVNGMKQVRQKLPDVITVFIVPPDAKSLHMRLLNRGELRKARIRRMKTTLLELEQDLEREYDNIIINDDIDKTVEKLKRILSGDRMKEQFDFETFRNEIHGIMNRELNT